MEVSSDGMSHKHIWLMCLILGENQLGDLGGDDLTPLSVPRSPKGCSLTHAMAGKSEPLWHPKQLQVQGQLMH